MGSLAAQAAVLVLSAALSGAGSVVQAHEDALRVAIVLDPTFGTRLPALGRRMPVFAVDSDANRRGADRAFNELGNREDFLYAVGVSTFAPVVGTAEEQLAAQLSAVEAIHGAGAQHVPFLGLRVYGLQPTADAEAVLRGHGFTEIEGTRYGLSAWR